MRNANTASGKLLPLLRDDRTRTTTAPSPRRVKSQHADSEEVLPLIQGVETAGVWNDGSGLAPISWRYILPASIFAEGGNAIQANRQNFQHC